MAVTPVDSKRGDAVYNLIVPDNNYGKSEDIHIYSWTQSGKLNVNRVLIDFNLDEMPSNAKIDSAHLNLFFNPSSAYNRDSGNKGNQGKDNIIIQRITTDWSENDVTWNKQPATTIKNQVIIAKLGNNQADYLNIDVTKIIRDITKSKNNRYGIMIRHQNEQPYNFVYFASSEHPEIKLHPKLIVYYRK